MNGQSFRSFEEFWPFYVGEHLNPTNRKLHFIGTTCFWILALSHFWAIGIVIAYAFAWTGHFFYERNKPATFQHPFYSIRGDFRMYGMMLRGSMQREIERLGIDAARLRRRSETADGTA